MVTLSERWRVYFASMFDHTGTCTVTRHERGEYVSHVATVDFNHLTMEQAAEIGKLIGLGVLTEGTYPGKFKKCRWHLRMDELGPFLDIVEPYVVLRHEQIRILREFLAVRGKVGEAPTQEMIETREACVARMQELTCGRGRRNGRGSEPSGRGAPVEGDFCRSGV
jgi:hypothetical protein